MSTLDEYDSQIYVINKLDELEELGKNIKFFDKERFDKLFKLLNLPITVIHEKYYIDKIYRDTYYSYFSSKHFEIDRNCQRVTLFQGNLGYDDFLGEKEENIDLLQEKIIGTVVIKPTIWGNFGRTLLNPSKLNIKASYIRTTKFNVIIMGKNFKIDAYPFSSQDTETMTCAETSIWTILEYYGHRYPEHKVVMPSEIMCEVDLSSDERTLPSRGLTFLQKSNLLKKFGFSPRVYSGEIYTTKFKNLFHYYVESGIPLTISLPGHSVVCVGHAESNYDLSKVNSELIGGYKCIDSSEFFNEYVIIDDNQIPYEIEEYDHFSIHKDKEMKLFTVPLYKRIFLEANDAIGIVDSVLNQCTELIEDYFKVKNITYDENRNPLIKRLFLTTSRKYKQFRINNTQNGNVAYFYNTLPYPKFIWVLEISLYDQYLKKEVFGEVILDATAARYTGFNSIILIRIGHYVGYRLPNEPFEELSKRLFTINPDFGDTYKLYENNLILGGIS